MPLHTIIIQLKCSKNYCCHMRQCYPTEKEYSYSYINRWCHMVGENQLPPSCPLTPTYILWHRHTHTHIHISHRISKCTLNFLKKIDVHHLIGFFKLSQQRKRTLAAWESSAIKSVSQTDLAVCPGRYVEARWDLKNNIYLVILKQEVTFTWR